jgi:hypothetical protein
MWLIVIGKENVERFLHAPLMHMHQLVTFGELSNDVDTTRTGSMRVVASRVILECDMESNLLGKAFGSVTTN